GAAAARVRRVMVRPLHGGTAGDRIAAGEPPWGGAREDRGWPGQTSRPLVPGEAVADAGAGAGWRRARARGAACVDCRPGAACVGLAAGLSRMARLRHSDWPDRLWIVRHGQSAGNVARDRAE